MIFLKKYRAGEQRHIEVLKAQNLTGRSRKFESLEPQENRRLLHLLVLLTPCPASSLGDVEGRQLRLCTQSQT